MVSRRPDTQENQDEIAATLGDYREAFSQVLLVGERLKDEAARESGIEVDVWVDDSPQFIRSVESRALGDIVEGDTVTWGEGLVGIVSHIMLAGTLNLGETEMEATPDDPAVLVSLITDGEVTNVQEAVKLAALTKVEANAYGYGKLKKKPTKRDCGTGSGGFKPGNKCAGEGGGGESDSGGGGSSGGDADTGGSVAGNATGEPSSVDLRRVFQDVSKEALSLQSGSDPKQVQERSEIKKEITRSVLAKLDEVGVDEDSISRVLLSQTGFNNPKYQEGAQEGYEKRHALVRGVIDTWATTSGDSEPVAVGIQKAIAEEFAYDFPEIAEAGTAHLGNYQTNFGNKQSPGELTRLKGIEETVAKSSAVREVLRAQYNATQDYFKKQGIKELTLHRGFINEAGVKSSENEDLKLQPASSFSMNRKTAEMFADNMSTSISGMATVTVPVSRVLCTARTGMGCVTEQEIVVLGGPLKGKVTAGSVKRPVKGAAAAALKAAMEEMNDD
jgi:hypothetical protein